MSYTRARVPLRRMTFKLQIRANVYANRRRKDVMRVNQSVELRSLGGISLCRTVTNFFINSLMSSTIGGESCKSCFTANAQGIMQCRFHSTKFAYFVQPKSRPAPILISISCCHSAVSFRLARGGKETEKLKNCFFMAHQNARHMQCSLKNICLASYFFTMRLTYLAVTIFGSLVCLLARVCNVYFAQFLIAATDWNAV